MLHACVDNSYGRWYDLYRMNPAKPHILIVEDDGFLREIYLEALNDGNSDVESATNGDEALAKIKEGGWDLVLLDIVMPKMDGLEVVKTIKADTTLQGRELYKRLVFLTNLDNDVDMKDAEKLSNGYIVKSSITPGELVSKVREFLSAPAPTSVSSPSATT